jgi:hypothetical protein
VLPLLIAPDVREKLLTRHKVSEKEIVECLLNLEGDYLIDPRSQHNTNPKTEWFISVTNRDRVLKVILIPFDDHLTIRSAYEPEPAALQIYERRCGVKFDLSNQLIAKPTEEKP